MKFSFTNKDLLNQEVRPHQIGPFIFAVLSLVVGIVAGFGAIVFRGLISFFHNLFMLGTFSMTYDATKHTSAGPWGAGIILVPVIGSFIVTYLVKNFAPEARGHGVPEVMEAIYYKKGIIRPVVAAVKSLASALSIGTGGSVGREGPIIQIGASFGSSLGQIFDMMTWQRITLIAAGAGGGIAATFNTPIGGILFAIEIMMQEISVRTLVPVSIATATATYIARFFYGTSPAFMIPGLNIHDSILTSPEALILFVILGLIMGLVSALYIKAIYGFEDLFFKSWKTNDYVRHAAGMLCIGLMMYAMIQFTGYYYIQGVGYATIQDILSHKILSIGFLLLLAFLKLLSVSLTLGSGASGGVFSPGLFMGATLGAAFGIISQALFPGLGITGVAFVVAGMAGVIAGSTGAAMAAIVMLFEMTLDYQIILPVTLTVALSYGIRKLLVRNSIYTMKVARRGRYMPEALQANYHHEILAKEMIDAGFKEVSDSTSLEELSYLLSENKEMPWFIRTDDEGKVDGVVSRDRILIWLSQHNMDTVLKDLPFASFESVSPNSKLFEVTSTISKSSSALVIVAENNVAEAKPDNGYRIDNVLGIITRDNVAKVMEQAMQLFSE